MSIPDSVTAAAFRAPVLAAPSVAAPRRRESADGAGSAVAPAGTNATPGAAAPASLWDALSADERAFFLDTSAHGPLTYAATAPRADSDATPAPVGQRLDLRA